MATARPADPVDFESRMQAAIVGARPAGRETSLLLVFATGVLVGLATVAFRPGGRNNRAPTST